MALAPGWSQELPEDAAKLVAAFDRKRHDLEAKATADVAKEIQALIKTLEACERRETKARHSEAAVALRSKLESLAATSPAVITRGNKPFPEFLKELRLSSEGYQIRDGTVVVGNASIALDGHTMNCQRGLNVLAVVDGKPALEKTYEVLGHFPDLVAAIKALPKGAYVVMALKDDIAHPMPDECTAAFQSLGAKEGLVGKPANTAYLLIGAKGMQPGEAVEMMGPQRIVWPVEGR
ncbi:MAG: hypothetical protein H0V44_06250 [Planctomycetes bacterium]|nr:hypothetical protein [Planctomycetota bacterium]